MPSIANRRFATKQAVLGTALLIPFYLAPLAMRIFLFGPRSWVAGLLFFVLCGSLCIGFLTNDYRFGVLLCCGWALAERLLLGATGEFLLTVAAGGLAPALVAAYFAQLLYFGLGE